MYLNHTPRKATLLGSSGGHSPDYVVHLVHVLYKHKLVVNQLLSRFNNKNAFLYHFSIL